MSVCLQRASGTIVPGRMKMNRREFFKTAIGGAVAVGGMGALGRFASAAETPTTMPEKVDANQLAIAADKYFIKGDLTCSESILWAGCDALNIKNDLIPDIALGLGGGIGWQGKTCGIITGAAMVISLAVAAKEKNYKPKKKRTLFAAGDLYKKFETACGSCDCLTLCGLDLTTPEGREKLESEVKAKRCAKFVQAGAKLLAEQLNEVLKPQEKKT